MSHRNSKTPAEVKIVKLGGAYADVRRKDLIDRKLEVLRRIQAGEDPDAVGLAAMRVVFQEDRAIEDEGSFWVMYQEDSIVEDESSFWVTFEDEASVREMFQEERDIEASFFEGFTDAADAAAFLDW